MSVRRLLLGGLVALLIAGLLAALVTWRASGDDPTYEVVRGDTLFHIARAHGVTVEDLRAHNALEGDLIEVGQILRIPAGAAPASKPAATPARRAARSRPPSGDPSPAGPTAALAMPPARACLQGPSLGDGDRGMAASQGLTEAQVSTAMAGFVHHTLACLGDAAPAAPLELEITVACTGRVDRVAVLSLADWPPGVAACVADVLRYTPFPPHDLPDGETFRYPLRFTPG